MDALQIKYRLKRVSDELNDTGEFTPEGEGITCDCCGDHVPEGDEYNTPSGETWCSDCFYEQYTYCEDCGETVDRDYTVTVDEYQYCEYCADNNSWYCDDCNERHSDNETSYDIYDSYDTICADGLQRRGLSICEDCCVAYEGDSWDNKCPDCTEPEPVEEEEEK